MSMGLILVKLRYCYCTIKVVNDKLNEKHGHCEKNEQKGTWSYHPSMHSITHMGIMVLCLDSS